MTDERREPKRPVGWLEWLLAVAVVALVVQLVWPAWQMWKNRPRPGVQVTRAFGPTGYLLYLPREYNQRASWPLLVYLHGGGQSGTNPSRIADGGGPPGLIARGRAFPMIVVAPQCLPDQDFNAIEVLAVVDWVMKGFHVDTARVYLTGYSRGGGGTWNVALADPGRFAAIAPVCGVADATRAETLKDLPIWVFHGAKDDVIPIRYSQTMVAALRAAGGHARLTVYGERGHDICGLTYNNADLYTWLLSQRRTERCEVAGGQRSR